MICGIMKPTSGTIKLGQYDVTDNGYRNLLGYLPQDFGYYPEFSGMDFMLYIATLKGLDKGTAKRRSRELLERVNLTEASSKKIKTYSGGMKQRLLLASALLGNPKLLILDEPTAGLDPKERVRLRELLADMAKDRIILVATHVVSDVETVATKVILLRAGKIVDAAPVPELIEKYAPDQGLEDVYLNVFGEGDGK